MPPEPTTAPDDSEPSAPELGPRRKRLLFRAWHRGTKETDLMVGNFVARHLAAFTDAELDELEAVLELQDVDMADWLSGRRPIPAEHDLPMLRRMAAACAESGAGTAPGMTRNDGGRASAGADGKERA